MAELRRMCLDNGMKVVMILNPQSTAVATALHVNTGCRNEPAAGLAHLAEHVLGSPTSLDGPSTEAIFRMGGRTNARTSLDYTQYTHITPPSGLATIVARERQRLSITSVDGDRLAREKSIIKSEISRNVTQRPHGGLVMFELPKRMYGDFANAHNGYGDISSMEAIRPEDCQVFLRTHYIPQRVTLSIAGNFSFSFAEELLSGWEGGQDPMTGETSTKATETSTISGHFRRKDGISSDTRIAIGLPSPDPLKEPRRHLAAVILSESMPALISARSTGVPDFLRANWRLNRNGSPFDQVGPALFAVDLPVPDNASAARLVESLQRFLTELEVIPDLDSIIDKTQRSLKLALLSDLDNPLSAASWAAAGEGVFGDPERQWRLAAEISSVSIDEIKTVASTLSATKPTSLTSTAQATPEGSES